MSPLPHEMFRQIREESGLSQNRLSIEAGYDHSYVSRIENNSRRPTREALERFLDAMQLTGTDNAYELMDAYGYVTDRHILVDEATLETVRMLQENRGA